MSDKKRWICISCGAPADREGETGCSCLGKLLYHPSDHKTMFCPSQLREDISDIEAEIARVRKAVASGFGEGSREDRMVVLRRGTSGKATVWCDPEIVDLVEALNSSELATTWSCSGHGHRPGMIGLADGRQLMVFASLDHAKPAEAVYPLDINGEQRP